MMNFWGCLRVNKDNDNKDLVNDEKEIDNNIGTENLEKDENNKGKKSKFSVYFYWKYIYYIIIIVVCIVARMLQPSLSVTLGDFGSLIPLLLNILALGGLRWCPIFAVVGIILLIFEKKFSDVSKIYLIITGIVTVVSILLQFIV